MKNKGFTLVELIVVVAIIAVLITMSMASYSTINKRSRDTRRKSDIAQISSSLEAYRADNKYYPNTGNGSFTQVSGLPLDPTYISVIPTDPNSSVYYYYRATNLVSGRYYGYCLSANLEAENPDDSCTPNASPSQNYGISNP